MDIFNFKNNNLDDIYAETNTRQVVISVEQLGRRRVTHVNGWKLPKEKLLFHLKEFKKKNGCNGNIKEFDEKDVYELSFQGDKVNEIKDYLIKNGVNEDIIYIQGYVKE